MDPSHLHHHHNMSVSGGDRLPQWSVQETRDFLMIRAELDPTFMETKRNKVLWEIISTKMKERGYNRSGEQCKCKWKNLVTRYKGVESMEQEGMRQQFPFYNELQAILMQRMEAEGRSSSKKRDIQQQLSSDEEEKASASNYYYYNKIKRNKQVSSSLKELMKQHMEIEMRWMKLYESKEEERRIRDKEWRLKMEALENERIMFDRSWREKEEETRIIQETRSQKRDALITILLNKLRPPKP